jgi:hypothetical protein
MPGHSKTAISQMNACEGVRLTYGLSHRNPAAFTARPIHPALKPCNKTQTRPFGIFLIAGR